MSTTNMKANLATRTITMKKTGSITQGHNRQNL